MATSPPRSGGQRQLFKGLFGNNNNNNSNSNSNRVMGSRKVKSAAELLQELDSPATSATELIDYDVAGLDDHSHCSSPPDSPLFTKRVSFVEPEITAEVSADISHVKEEEEPATVEVVPSATTVVVPLTGLARQVSTERIDDRFGSLFNMCDSDCLEGLRENRMEDPVIIHEDDGEPDDEEDQMNELWARAVQSNHVPVKSFLKTPSVHRMATGVESDPVTPFVVDHIGFLHPNVPQIFIV